MSSPIFDVLISRFPDERLAIERLADLARDWPTYELTFDHLVARLRPRSVERLALILAELTRLGSMRRVIRVESRERGGIADFTSLQDVPSRIHDWRTDEEVEVTPDKLLVLYMAR